jgi:hypothetical protein
MPNEVTNYVADLLLSASPLARLTEFHHHDTRSFAQQRKRVVNGTARLTSILPANNNMLSSERLDLARYDQSWTPNLQDRAAGI